MKTVCASTKVFKKFSLSNREFSRQTFQSKVQNFSGLKLIVNSYFKIGIYLVEKG